MEKLQILFSTLGDQYEEEGELQLGCAEELYSVCYTVPIPILLITITLGLLLLGSGSGSDLSLETIGVISAGAIWSVYAEGEFDVNAPASNCFSV